MHARGIHGMYGMHAGHDSWNDRPGQLVDKSTEAGVLLRRPADHGEGPDGVLAMIDLLHMEDRERMPQAVVTEMIAEGPFGQEPLGIDHAADAKVRVSEDRQAAL